MIEGSGEAMGEGFVLFDDGGLAAATREAGRDDTKLPRTRALHVAPLST